jgi:hypothetical protein
MSLAFVACTYAYFIYSLNIHCHCTRVRLKLSAKYLFIYFFAIGRTGNCARKISFVLVAYLTLSFTISELTMAATFTICAEKEQLAIIRQADGVRVAKIHRRLSASYIQ